MTSRIRMGLQKVTGTKWKRLFFLAFGIGAVAILINQAGSAAVSGSLVEAATVIPLLLLLEGGRIGCEATCTRWIVIGAGGSVPWGTLIRASVVSYSVCIITPIGRPVGEAVRAAMIESFAGPERATLAATTNQTLTLVSNAVLAAAAAILVVALQKPSFLTVALGVYTIVACGIAFAIQVIARSRRFVSWLVSIAPRYRRNIVRFYRSSRQTAYLPLRPVVIMIAGRGLQALQFGVLVYALGFGFGLDTVLIGQGLNLIGSAIGDWIPAQIGTIDGLFTVAASSICVPSAVGLTIAVMIHCVQLSWAAIGALLPLIGSARQKPIETIQIP